MGCYLEDYRALVITWAARTSWPHFTKKWTSVLVLRDNDSVCNDFRSAICNWWGR
jgi:hypothetical protein